VKEEVADQRDSSPGSSARKGRSRSGTGSPSGDLNCFVLGDLLRVRLVRAPAESKDRIDNGAGHDDENENEDDRGNDTDTADHVRLWRLGIERTRGVRRQKPYIFLPHPLKTMPLCALADLTNQKGLGKQAREQWHGLYSLFK